MIDFIHQIHEMAPLNFDLKCISSYSFFTCIKFLGSYQLRSFLDASLWVDELALVPMK